MIMKKIITTIVLVILICLVLITGCTGEDSSNNKRISIDDTFEKIKVTKFQDFTLSDLNYEKINKTKIFINNEFIGKREYLVDEDGNSSQRLLQFTSKDGTSISIILGKLKEEESIEDDTLTVYADGLKNIGLKDKENPENISIHSDSTVYSINNLLINVLSINVNSELDIEKVIKFKEQLIESLNNM